MFETRPATADDAETLAMLASNVFCETYLSAFSSEQQVAEYVSRTFLPTAFATELNTASAWYTLGIVDGRAAGFIKMGRTAPPACVDPEPAIELSKLYVLRQFHGCGIASQLMARGLEYASDQQLSQVWLCVWEHNARAQSFYRRWEFKTVGDLVIQCDGVPFRDLVMKLCLNRTRNDQSRENYSVGYDTAATDFFATRRARTQAAFFLPHLSPGMRLLDGGCGPGTVTIDLAASVAPGEVVGIDIEPGQIELARRTAVETGTSNIRFEVGDLYVLPFPDESFDAVFLHGVLEHSRYPVRGLREVMRVLRCGGILGARHVDFGGFLLEPAPSPLDQFVPLFERLMLHNGADPRAGRHQLRWLNEAGFTRIEMSASCDCWTSTPEHRLISARFLNNLVSDSAFARQLVAAGLADPDLLDAIRTGFIEWGLSPVSFASETWTEAVGRKPQKPTDKLGS